MATKPANAPFNIVVISDFPNTTQEINVAATAPAPAASVVFKATNPKNAPSTDTVLPALNQKV